MASTNVSMICHSGVNVLHNRFIEILEEVQKIAPWLAIRIEHPHNSNPIVMDKVEDLVQRLTEDGRTLVATLQQGEGIVTLTSSLYGAELSESVYNRSLGAMSHYGRTYPLPDPVSARGRAEGLVGTIENSSVRKTIERLSKYGTFSVTISPGALESIKKELDNLGHNLIDLFLDRHNIKVAGNQTEPILIVPLELQ